ncbi:hypothetical protein BJV78DRAFT_242445 [Lactifluus subvellereus]|nr:hypothetical protein BJV78DRAFT_242445 [Lactifluus subvellereus]
MAAFADSHHSLCKGQQSLPVHRHSTADSDSPAFLPFLVGISLSYMRDRCPSRRPTSLRVSTLLRHIPLVVSHQFSPLGHSHSLGSTWPLLPHLPHGTSPCEDPRISELNVPPDLSYRYDPYITRSPSIKSQHISTSYLYALPEAMPQDREPLTGVHRATSTFTVPLTPPGNLDFPLVTLRHDQEPSRDLPQRLRQLSKEPDTVLPARSPALSSRSAGTRKAPKGPYSCENCNKTFACCQVLYRHQREIHEPDWCIFCDDFKWARPYLLKEHLIKKHPELDTDAALADTMKDHNELVNLLSMV